MKHEECLRCGRKLKNPKYQEIGRGKICQKKHEAEQLKDDGCGIPEMDCGECSYSCKRSSV